MMNEFEYKEEDNKLPKPKPVVSKIGTESELPVPEGYSISPLTGEPVRVLRTQEEKDAYIAEQLRVMGEMSPNRKVGKK